MKIVLDNNILFSIMNPKSISSYVFYYIKAEFLAPKFIKTEFNKYKELCLRKSGLSEHEFEIREFEFKQLINFIEESGYEKFLLKAIKNLPDPKDSPYLALALAEKASIWSNDPHLKEQQLISVFSTAELVNEIIKGNI